MVSAFDFNHFIEGFKTALDEASLHAILDEIAHELGFEQFAMGHHVDLTRPPEDAIRLTTYDNDWIEQSLSRGYFFDDPIHAASVKTTTAFFWHDVDKLIRLTDRQRAILDEARKYGLGTGCTIPIHLPGEYRGTCSFGAASFDRLRPNALPIAHMAGAFAFESARRIMRKRDGGLQESPPDITQRQHDTLVLVGRGKTDSEIGTILGISRATAHEHVENVRKAYGNAQRPYLIARALFDGLVTYAELFRR